MHCRAKFHQNQSIRCSDVTIFQFFKTVAICHLAFCLGLVWTTHKVYLVVFNTVQNFTAISAVDSTSPQSKDPIGSDDSQVQDQPYLASRLHRTLRYVDDTIRYDSGLFIDAIHISRR